MLLIIVSPSVVLNAKILRLMMVAVLTERETLGLEGIYKWHFLFYFPSCML